MLGIERARRKKGFSQAELASRLGVTQGAVSQWELGTAVPRSGLLLKMSDVLECAVDVLLKSTQEEEETNE